MKSVRTERTFSLSGGELESTDGSCRGPTRIAGARNFLGGRQSLKSFDFRFDKRQELRKLQLALGEGDRRDHSKRVGPGSLPTKRC